MGALGSDNRQNNNGKNAFQFFESPATYFFGDDAGFWLDPGGNITGHGVQNVDNWVSGYHDPEGSKFMGGGSGTDNLNHWMQKNLGGIFDDKLGKNTDKWKDYYTDLQKKKDDLKTYEEKKDDKTNGLDRTSGGGLTGGGGLTSNTNAPYLDNILDSS